MTTAIVHAPALEHNKTGHPEHQGRIRQIVAFFG